MVVEFRTLLLWVAIAPVSGNLADAAQVSGRWHGQDRHDVVGDATALGPNGVQDIHISLSGLPSRHQIVKAVVTGKGADQWEYPASRNEHQYAAVIVRTPRAATADVFLEPIHVETGRQFCLKLTFDNGAAVDVYVKGGKADPNSRMPAAAMTALWIGQERSDLVGTGPGVGPDGLLDARIGLANLSGKEKVKAILLEDAAGTRWAYGVNKDGFNNAEIHVDPKDPTRRSFFFQPQQDLANYRLKLTVTYEGGKTDSTTVVAGKTDPKLALPKTSIPALAELNLTAVWLGQDGSKVTGPGDVHVALEGIPTNKEIAAAVLSDGVRRTWLYKSHDQVTLDVEPYAHTLALKRGSRRGSADLFFPPTRDETGTALTLRFLFEDGETGVTTIAGGPCDPTRVAPVPEATESVARPGDDLSGLVTKFGTVRLSKGTYDLRRPLLLPRPVTLIGEPGAVLRFTQNRDDAPWTTAIKILAGGTTLRGFGVRFNGPIRWRHDVNWGPAVIGTTDNLDGLPEITKPGLVFENLDLGGPAATNAEGWQEAVKLMRLLNVPSGRIVGNTLHGGYSEFFEGPWLVENNVYRGTDAHTFTPAVFAVHDPHDLVVRNNKAKPEPQSGKTWRFLLLTNRGAFDRVESNVISGIGPRDDDTIPSMNQPEVILTESYHLRFEGRPAAVSADGRLVKVRRLPGEAPLTGDVVSVLTGTGAGEFRRIAQRIEPTLFLLDAPLPRGADVVSISPGFVNDVYQSNTIDARGGGAAAGFVLAGNHFGTVVANNRVTGAGDAFQLSAYPSESPNIWGWSHAPYLGGVFERNVIEDSPRGAQIGVLHNPSSKSNKGRVYLRMSMKGNTVRWSDAFLNRPTTDGKNGPPGITLGWLPSIDPGEAVIEMNDSRVVAPSGAPVATALRINSATVNHRAVYRRSFTLPMSPGTATGVNVPASSGTSANPERPRAADPSR